MHKKNYTVADYFFAGIFAGLCVLIIGTFLVTRVFRTSRRLSSALIFLMGALLHFHLVAMYLNAGKRRAFVFFALAALLVLAAFASIFY